LQPIASFVAVSVATIGGECCGRGCSLRAGLREASGERRSAGGGGRAQADRAIRPQLLTRVKPPLLSLTPSQLSSEHLNSNPFNAWLNMAPTLPTELLAEILALENADQSPIQRQLNRQRFELVCKSWFSSVDRWSELAIQGTAGLRNARRVFEADDEYSDEAGVMGPRVRSICFSIEAGAQTRVGRVVRRVVNLSRFEMSGYYRDDVRSLGKNLPDQLSGLTRLQHFNLKRVDLSIEDLTK
jgi:hypothetical protein